MSQHRHGHGLHIVGQDVLASLKRGARLRRTEESQRAARAGAEVHVIAFARAAGKLHDVAFYLRRNKNLADGIRGIQNFLCFDDGLERIQRMLELLLLEDTHLVRDVGIAQADAQEEAIQLRFGERERPLVFDGILRGKHHERARQFVGHAVHRHLALLHGFEQGGLRLGRGAVDLVCQHDLSHDRAGTELELLFGLVIDGDAGHVAGKHVGRKLDAAEGAVQRAGETARQHRLADARHVLDQHVSLAQQADDNHFHGRALADDHLFQIADHNFTEGLDVFHADSFLSKAR